MALGHRKNPSTSYVIGKLGTVSGSNTPRLLGLQCESDPCLERPCGALGWNTKAGDGSGSAPTTAAPCARPAPAPGRRANRAGYLCENEIKPQGGVPMWKSNRIKQTLTSTFQQIFVEFLACSKIEMLKSSIFFQISSWFSLISMKFTPIFSDFVEKRFNYSKFLAFNL